MTIYVNNHSFELAQGESIEAVIVWPWLPLVGLTLKIGVVGDRAVRLDSRRRLRRRGQRWRVFRVAPAKSGA